MMQVNTYKQTKNQTLDNAWIKDYALSYDHLQGDMEV